MKTNYIMNGDALTHLKELPNESINCVMTSPPYWALRDYGVDNQLGLEPTFQEYINKLCDIFDEVKRVLRKDGTCWVNLGDTYNAGRSGGHAGGINGLDRPENAPNQSGVNVDGLLPKSLVLIPFRFAIEMQNRGWILRNVIIWHKRNCMPSSVKDRFTVDFEYLFFFVKNKKYWFETQREPNEDSWGGRWGKYTNKKMKICKGSMFGAKERSKEEHDRLYSQCGRNKRTVWTINPKPFKEAHFAVYPEELCETPIKAGCPVNGIVLDPFFGSGTTGLVALKQNKQFIGIELNKEYIKIAMNRLRPYLEQTKLPEVVR